MEQNEKLFTDGFNNGYLLAKFEPELAKKLTAENNNAHSDYFKGLVSGKQELQMEKVRERMKGLSQNNTPPAPTINKSKGRER